MSRLIIVLAEKGGVAKTFLAIHLTTFLHGKGVKVRPVDMDQTPGLLTRVFPGPDSAGVNPDTAHLLQGKGVFPQLIERALKGEPYLIDCGANSGRAWQLMFEQVRPRLAEELRANGVKVTLIAPVSSDTKTSEFFKTYRDDLFPFATLVMVVVRDFRNEEFALPMHPAELTIELPWAPPALFSYAKTHDTSFDRIAQSAEPAMKLYRGLAERYLPKLHATFIKIQSHLLP